MGFVLVIGGARSGKSRFAEQLADRAGKRVLYVATASAPGRMDGSEPTKTLATAVDDEMTERIRRHRARRPSSWMTLEEPLNIEPALTNWLDRHDPPDAILIDCLTLLISNWLLTADVHTDNEEAWSERVRRLVDFLDGLPCLTVVVSNETGSGIVPVSKLGRTFRDLSGLANQWLSERAEAVYTVWAGIPVDLKSLDVRRHWSEPAEQPERKRRP